MGKDEVAPEENPQGGTGQAPVDQGKGKTQSAGAGAGGTKKPVEGADANVDQGPGGS